MLVVVMPMQTTLTISTSNAQGIDISTCPVCGYDLEEPIQPYDICSSCGTEFGVSDVNSTIAKLREAWLETGPRWWSPVTPSPVGWDPHRQLQRLIGVVRPKESETVSRPFERIWVTHVLATAGSHWVDGVLPLIEINAA